MKLAACVILASFLAAPATARTKPGPVTVRGVAASVTASTFTLRSPSRGLYSVTVTADTAVSEKGIGRVRLRNGDHVGVRGFLQGRRIRAITVHVYPTVPRPYSVKGRVVAVTAKAVTIAAPGRTVRARVTASTSVQIGSHAGSIQGVHPGDRVLARLRGSGASLILLHLHVYRRQASKRHVQVVGVLAAVERSAVDVRSSAGVRRIALTGRTLVYVGVRRAGRAVLRAGLQVHVYACCAGQPLVALSIHVRTTPVTHRTTLLKGVVADLSPSRLVLGSVAVRLTRATVYEVGSRRVARSAIRVGDHAGVRAARIDGALTAVRVHVYASYRVVHTLRGSVISVSTTGFTLQALGRRYAVAISARTVVTLNRALTHISSLRAGDRVQVTGTEDGRSVAAIRVTATRLPPALHTVHGTVTSVSGRSVVLKDNAGVLHHIQLIRGARIVIHARPAPIWALFVGVQATARGTLSSGVLLASTVSLSLEIRVVEGTLLSRRPNALVLSTGPATRLVVDLPGGVPAWDEGRRVRPARLHIGALLRVRAYASAARRIRAIRLRVLHPTVDVTGVVTGLGPDFSIRSTSGRTYRIHTDGGTTILTGTERVDLNVDEIPVGVHVHVTGKLLSDGSVSAHTLTVHLQAITARGTITAVGEAGLTLDTGGESQIRVGASTRVSQGSRAIAISDLVVGDSVTVSGYRGADALLARQIAVHRKLVGLDGVVQTVETNGFMLLVGGAPVRVLTEPDTSIGATIMAGASVHVTGYRRGDGVILATRVVPGKKHASTATRAITQPRA